MDNGEVRGDQYDDESEDYVAYWQGRDYEHAAEIAAVKRLIARGDGTRYGLVCEVGAASGG